MTIDYLTVERIFAEVISACDFYFKSAIHGETKAIPLTELTNYLNKRRAFYKNKKKQLLPTPHKINYLGPSLLRNSFEISASSVCIY